MTRLLARVARWSLPVALVVAALVAAYGLGGVLFARPSTPRPAPAVALDLPSCPTPADCPPTGSARDVRSCCR